MLDLLKKLIDRFFFNEETVYFAIFLLVKEFIREDLPTLDRPQKINSGICYLTMEN